MDAITAEFIGTALLLLMGCSVVANTVLTSTKGHGGGWIVITTGWALAVFIGVTVAAPFSGAHLNPAVTLALAIHGTFAWADAPGFIAAQMLGAGFGSWLAYQFYRSHFAVTGDAGLKLAVFCNTPAIPHVGRNLFCEALGTFVLVYAVLHVSGAEVIDHETQAVSKVGLGSLGAVPVALIVFAIGLSLGGTTGYAINPARDLSPRIVHALVPIADKGSSQWGYAWIPVAGPIIGGVAAAVLTRLLG